MFFCEFPKGVRLFVLILFFLSIFIHQENFFPKAAPMYSEETCPPGSWPITVTWKKEVLFPSLLSNILRCISNFFLKVQPLICPPALTVASERCHTDCSEEMPSFYLLNSTGSCFLHCPLLNAFLIYVGKNNL